MKIAYFVILLTSVVWCRAADPFVYGEVLDSNQTVLALDSNGRVPVNIGDSFYIKIHGSVPSGHLSNLYVRLYDSQNTKIVQSTDSVWGWTVASKTYGPFIADEYGIWDLWMHATSNTAGSYQWQGGGWWGDHSPDLDVKDLVSPTVPSALNASAVTASDFNLNWTASTDNIGVTAYEVRRDGTSEGTTSSTSMAITGLTQGTDYTMSVRARDAQGNWSAWSSDLVVSVITVATDTDGDGMSDVWEIANGLDENTDDAALDPDDDDLSNLEEYHLNTDPNGDSSNPAGGSSIDLKINQPN